MNPQESRVSDPAIHPRSVAPSPASPLYWLVQYRNTLSFHIIYQVTFSSVITTHDSNRIVTHDLLMTLNIASINPLPRETEPSPSPLLIGPPHIHPMKSNIILMGAALAALAPVTARSAVMAITPGTYTQNFDSLLPVPNSEPAPGWKFRTGSTASSLGTQANIVNAPLWSETGGGFRNVSSTNIAADSDAAAQNANTNRAIGMRQVRIGNYSPGAAICFEFSTTAVQINSISMDLLLLEDGATRETTFDIQYGLGASPGSFTTLGSWTNNGVFGATNFSFDRDDFGSALDDGSRVWFRLVALTASPGSGGTFDLVGIDNFSINASAVPEPSAALLGAVGILGLFRRR